MTVVSRDCITGQVVIGASGELYLASERHQTILYWTRAKTAHPDALSKSRDCISARTENAYALGVKKYVHIVAPDKHVVYEDHLPFPLEYSLGRDYQSELLAVPFVYPEHEFRKYLPGQVYRKTDSHWGGLGNAIAAKVVASSLGISEVEVARGFIDLLGALKMENDAYCGDLGQKLPHLPTESLYNVVPDWDFSILQSTVGGNEGMVACLTSAHPDAKGKLVIFGDSFMFQSLPAMSRYFREVICLRTRSYHHEIVAMARPDYVLTENVERYLSDAITDASAPPFFLMPYLKGRSVEYPGCLSETLSQMLSAGNLKV